MKERLAGMNKVLTPTVIEALKKITNSLLTNENKKGHNVSNEGCIQISRQKVKDMFYIIVKDCSY